ncbi:MAG: hypothetical protein ACJ74O_00765 [Frankiaceae bacterium]
MAGTSPASQSGSDSRARWMLALAIVTLSVIGITIASVVAIAFATSADRPEMARLVFSAVLPLFGTWVGTVLAFYFARENLAAATTATQSVTESALRLTQRLRPDAPVPEVMIQRSSMVEMAVASGTDPRALLLADLRTRMVNAHVHRLPILDASGAALYVVHDSTLAWYAESVSAPAGVLPGTLGDLLDNVTYGPAIRALGFVGSAATVADARREMAAVPFCNDVFVTKTGARSEAVVGWITNTLLAEIV